MVTLCCYEIIYRITDLLTQAPVILAAVKGCKMTNEMPYNAWIAPPPTEIPNYVWSKKYDPKPLKIKSSKLIEIKVEEFCHPSKEVALRAAKMAVRGKSGMYFGSKVVGFVRPAAVHIRTPLAAEALQRRHQPPQRNVSKIFEENRSSEAAGRSESEDRNVPWGTGAKHRGGGGFIRLPERKKSPPTKVDGDFLSGGSRIRTGDPMLAKHVLYQLSYTPKQKKPGW